MTDNADTDPSSDFLQVTINKQPVELYKILKFEGLVGTGGEAKSAVASGLVRVNDKVVTEKRKKIVAGDTIGYGDTRIRIILTHADPASLENTDVAKKLKQKQKKSDKKSRPAITPKSRKS